MKKILFTCMMLAASATAMAVPAKRGIVRTICLADGTEIKVELRGDEYGHFWQAEDGTRYVEDTADNIYKAANMQELKQLTSAKRSKASGIRNRRLRKLSQNATKAPIYTGTKKGLLILAQFSDKIFKSSNNLALYKQIVNGENYSDASLGFRGSVRDYFRDQSEGLFDFDIDVVGPVTLANSYSYYGANNYWGDDMRPEEMIKEACELADKNFDIDFTRYDWDGDGEVDQVFVVYAGHGEASYNDKNTVWPHAWYLKDGAGIDVFIDGVRINSYACGSELGSDESLDGIGTICHEFSHCFGLPDLYDTCESGTNYGMMSWSLMDYGSYNDDGFTPPSYTSYEKMAVGWKQPLELTEDTEVTKLKPYSEGGDAYVLYNNGNRNEYILLENRQLTGWDSGLYGNGLLAIHVDYDSSIWEWNEVNCTNGSTGNTHQRCTVIPADGNYTTGYYNIANDAFPYSTATSITSSTKYATLYNQNTDGSYSIGMDVTDITQNTDGTISFNVSKNDNGGNENVNPSEYIFYESFDKCNGTGGNDDRWSGSIASSNFKPDNTDWTSSKSYGANKCAKFGNSNTMGITTTPSFTINGETKFTFMAAPWDKDNTGLELSVSGNATISPSTFTMTAHKWTTFTATINGQGNIKVKFTPYGRIFLDEVKAYSPTTSITDIEHNISEKNADRRIYSIDGRYAGNDINSLANGVYIINGKKFVK